MSLSICHYCHVRLARRWIKRLAILAGHGQGLPVNFNFIFILVVNCYSITVESFKLNSPWALIFKVPLAGAFEAASCETTRSAS